MKLPTEMARYQSPIIRPVMRAGASFVTALMPTGLSDSSPKVCSRYVTTSQYGATLTPEAERPAAITRIAKPEPTNRRPTPNFAGLDGSHEPRRIHNHANTGAKVLMKRGC